MARRVKLPKPGDMVVPLDIVMFYADDNWRKLEGAAVPWQGNADRRPADTDSGDRYHVALLMDMIRGGEHNLDPSEREGMIETLARLMERAGIEPEV